MKRKRVFYQNEPAWVIESFLISCVVFGGQGFSLVFLLLEFLHGFPTIIDNPGIFASLSIIMLIIPLIMYPEVISRFSWNIHLDEEKVWMKGDRIAAKWFRIQLPIESKYTEIVSITIEFSSKNSSGQSIRAWFYGPIWSKKRYLVIETDRGKKKRFHVSHFTDAALAEIIDEIAGRCEAAGNIYDGKRAADILFKL